MQLMVPLIEHKFVKFHVPDTGVPKLLAIFCESHLVISRQTETSRLKDQSLNLQWNTWLHKNSTRFMNFHAALHVNTLRSKRLK